MSDLLVSNKNRLKETFPAAFELVSAHGSKYERPFLPEGPPPEKEINTELLRSTTLVYFGIDRQLIKFILSLNGEINLIVIEEHVSRFIALLSEVDSENLFDRNKVAWLMTPDMLQDLEPVNFILGRLMFVNLEHTKPTALVNASLKRIKDSQAYLNDHRAKNGDTYLTMITYNRLDYTRLTLHRLKINTMSPIKLVIIDNNSADGTRDWLEAHKSYFPFIERVISMDRNLGCGRALNNGILYSLARSRRIGRIDNDILVPPGWLRDLNQVLDSPLQPHIVGGYVTDDPAVRALINRGKTFLVDTLKVYTVDCIGGCCNVYNASIFEDLGYFPEFPLYGLEDGGLCKAAREADYKIAIVDNVKLEHLSGMARSASDGESDYHALKTEQLHEWDESQH